RSFSSTPRIHADVSNPPEPYNPKLEHQKKRIIRIGPLPSGDLDITTLQDIFGPKISRTEGNHVLRILHHRRTSGSLADYGVDNLGRKYPNVKKANATKALKWLRETLPIDEARAAQEWAEKEANRISYELWLADPDNADSKYNDPAQVYLKQQQAEEEAGLGEQRIGILHVGPSQFERNIEQKRRERLEAMAKKAEEKEKIQAEEEMKIATGEYVRSPHGMQLIKPGQKTYLDPFGREHVDRRDEYQKFYQEKAESPFKSEEEMLQKTTLAQRLYPMTAFVFFICVLSYGFGHYYTPPDRSYRVLPELSPTTATLVAITAANVLVCVLWRVKPMWPVLTRYMMHVPGYPHPIQAIGNIFSHIQYEHLLGNMMFFLLIGSACHDLVGRGVFLGTYFSAGAVGTLVSLYWANLGRGVITAHSVGASAAVWGVAALYCLLTERDRIKIPYAGEFSFYPQVLFAGFLAVEVYGMVRRSHKTMDYASHLGGYATGAAVVAWLKLNGFK
ncbi:hypothetical protein EJ04DRAFT_418217, partial [Polyplosphaeria fusca]